MATPDFTAPPSYRTFPTLPAEAAGILNPPKFGRDWDAENDFGEAESSVLGGDWSPGGSGGSGPTGPTGGGGPGGGGSLWGKAGAGPNYGTGAGVAGGNGAVGAVSGGGGGGGGGGSDNPGPGGPDLVVPTRKIHAIPTIRAARRIRKTRPIPKIRTSRRIPMSRKNQRRVLVPALAPATAATLPIRARPEIQCATPTVSCGW
ncbi:MAG: hypothetical protein WKF37_02625 [Bryobacteraceae bacterium]